MKKIGLLSDTHSYIDEKLLQFFDNCDEIWHAGDIGNFDIVDKLSEKTVFRAVYGNIDEARMRISFPELLIFSVEDIKIVMTHIGGYPKRYHPNVKKVLLKEKPQIFISGHSHILKVMNDEQLNLLHINPGAYGRTGFHKVRTALRFTIDKKNIKDLEILEITRK
jgi:putative phosphoesterase